MAKSLKDVCSDSIMEKHFEEGAMFQTALKLVKLYFKLSCLDKYIEGLEPKYRFPYNMKAIYKNYKEFLEYNPGGTLLNVTEFKGFLHDNGYDKSIIKSAKGSIYYLDTPLTDWAKYYIVD